MIYQIMKLTEGQIKDILILKESLFEQIEKHQEGIKMLEENITVLDSFLKDSSFRKASELGIKNEVVKTEVVKTEVVKTEIAKKPSDNSTLIKRASDGKIIARAYVTAEQLSIVLDDEILIDVDTPPLRTFFLDRIVGDMKKRDAVEVENQKIQKESVIDYVINKEGPNIKEIIIKNYRQKERISELIKTAEWSLTRMLENANKG